MREFVIRDLNRFWLTFGQPSLFEVLMNGVREGNTEVVRATLESGGIKAETLAAALVVASSRDNTSSDNRIAEIRELLKKAGAKAPPDVDAETLKSYVGRYKNEQGLEFNVTCVDGKLFAAQGDQDPLSLMAVDSVTFRPIAFDNYGTLTFNVQAGKSIGLALKHGPETIQLKRVEETK
jgi:hypothetical protein